MRKLMFYAMAFAAMFFTIVGGSSSFADDTYPNRKISIVVPFSAGGSADRLARALASFWTYELDDTPIVVVDKPGASTGLGHTWFLQQPDDGYWVLMSPPTPYLASLVARKIIPVKWEDYEFINAQWQDYNIIAVPDDQPYKNLKELFEDMRNNPGKVNIGGLHGNEGHVTWLILLEKLGIPIENVNFISYDGGGPFRTALAGNQVSVGIVAAVGSEVIRGKIRPLAQIHEKDQGSWKAPLVNDELKRDYNVEIPILLSDVRTLSVHATLKEKHPDRYKKIVETYKKTLEREDFQTFLKRGAIGRDWLGPEKTKKLLNSNYETLAKYFPLLEK